jgi:biopolymer transport protein ExbB/TolQ
MSIIRAASEHFQSGQWPMWPILLVAIASMSITIERIVFLRRATVDKRKLLALLKSQVMTGNVQGAIKVCTGNPTPMTRIIQAGLMRFNRPGEEVQAAMDEAALEVIPELEKRTGYLAMLGNVATLVGLLGTIVGLIDSFGGVAGVDPTTKASLLAKGISEAMNCTAFGLLTAVPTLLAFAMLNGWTQRMLDDINEVSVKVVNLVLGHRQAMKAA